MEGLLHELIEQCRPDTQNGKVANYIPALAKADPNAIGCGSTVTNLMIDEILIKNDDNFEKTVDLFLTYFKGKSLKMIAH